MTAPNMAAVTASLETLLQNCSLNHHDVDHAGHRTSAVNGGEDGVGRSDTTLELNSDISLPHHWEQCLDLKTGEIYYINWRNGRKAKGDPRRLSEYYYSEEEEEEEEEEDDSLYDSEESSSESSPSSTKHNTTTEKKHSNSGGGGGEQQQVLVVAGCKSCFMYVMVPKQVEDCPKCNGQLLHFERSSSQNGGGGGNVSSL